jgi:hypothetical protein
MSYAAQRSLGGLTSVDVGARAFSDPMLAKASLDASSIMLAMAKVPQAQRLPLMQASLERLGVGSGEVVAEMKRGLARRGANPDQVAFDAMRLAIANTRLDRGLDNLNMRIASRSGWDSMVGLGDLSANDRATGCMITGGAQVVGGIASIIPVYGTIVGGIIGIGGGIAQGQLDCGREARVAAENAAAAEQRLAAAQATAAEQVAQAAAAARTKRIRTVAGGGAILLAVLGAAWLVLD